MTEHQREASLDAAVELLTNGEYARLLGELVEFESESQDPSKHDQLSAYLEGPIADLLETLGFEWKLYPNPVAGGGPILVADRIESDDFETVLTYAHGDVVGGMNGKWAQDRQAFVLDETQDRFYGRGTADNKGQHLINLLSLRTVIEARGGKLGFNIKFLMETSEEIGATGLAEFAEASAGLLAADVLIASDGPRVAADTPTLSLGSRGGMKFSLEVTLRSDAHHSGSWGGFIADPAIVLSHAIASISTRNGRINVEGWRTDQIDESLRQALDGCPFDMGEVGDSPDDWWGEPGLTVWEKTALWPSFSVLALDHANPNKPVNAIHPTSRAICGLRYPASLNADDIVPALKQHLASEGFDSVKVEYMGHMGATCGDPDTEWVRLIAESVQASLGRRPQVIPSNGGSLPNNVFTDILDLETIWIPHSYNSCSQHAPDEHILKSVVAEGLQIMTGIWWDIGQRSLGL